MKKTIFLTLILTLLLTACGGSAETASSADTVRTIRPKFARIAALYTTGNWDTQAGRNRLCCRI